VNRTIRAVHGAALDAALYAGSAAFAGGAALLAGIPQFREWGRIAFAPYLIGAAVAVVLARRGLGTRARWWLAGAVLLGAGLIPLVLEVTWRARTDPGLHAQSEVIVTEEAARALLDGRNPYAAVYADGPLRARPLATQTHFPYLPGMLAFGVPRALDGRAPLSDARVWFTVAAAATLALALARSRAGSDGRLLVAQVTLILPTGALLMATGGDDLPVVALMGLSLVLLHTGRPAASGMAIGAAAVLKQTAWPLLLFTVAASGKRGATLVTSGVIVVAVVMPFLVWDGPAFVEDVVRFPLGMGQGQSAAGLPTLGSLAVRAFPEARGTVTVVLVAIVAAAAAWFVLRPPRPGAEGAAWGAAAIMLLAFALAPSGRLGYLVYPANLAAWALMLRSHTVQGGAVPPGAR
jgi:hypothetical protein